VNASEANKEIVRRYVAAFNGGDFAELREIFAPDAVVQGVLGWGGLDVVEPIWREIHTAFAVEMTIDALVAEGDTVAARYTERGRFVAPFRGYEPTGKPFEIVAMEWFEIRDGRIARRWGTRDHASQARQMGMPLG
jgi:steroid delta-isomerase-like uncharacterized protein